MMFWIMFGVGVLLFLYGAINKFKKDSHCIFGVIGAFIIVISSVNLIKTTIRCSNLIADVEILPIVIKNKVGNIEKMKTTYIETTKEVFNGENNVNVYQSIDVVNKDLAKEIAKEISNLEKFVNDWNFNLVKLHNKYKFRFFTNYYDKPSIKHINLNDYLEKK